MVFANAVLKHNKDGGRHAMFRNTIKLGHLTCVNEEDARMAGLVIIKTVPDFLNEPYLGFIWHVTSTMSEQREGQGGKASRCS